MILKPFAFIWSNAVWMSETRKATCAKPPRPAVLLKLLRYRRLGTQRLQQLDQIRSVADTQQHFANLVSSEHIFPMDLLEAERLVGIYVILKFSLLYRNRDMIEEQESWYVFDVFHSLELSYAEVGCLELFVSR